MPAGEPPGSRAARSAAGFTLAELLVALALLAVLAGVLFGALATHARLARSLAQRVVEADAVRTAATVLGAELRRLHPTDVRALARDSLALRAFRGLATACGAGGAGALVVHYRGDRAPEPAKDSVLWFGSGGSQAVALVAAQPAAAAACHGVAAGVVQHWQTEPALPGRGVLLLFESGTYYLTAAALRYRIGSAGRQPLTAELFVHPPTGFGRPRAHVFEYHLAGAATAAFPAVGAVHFALPPPPGR